MIMNEPKRFHIEHKGFLLFCLELFRGSKYVVLIEAFKVLYRTFSSKSVVHIFTCVKSVTLALLFLSAYIMCNMN